MVKKKVTKKKKTIKKKKNPNINLTKAVFMKAIPNTGGILTDIAKKCNVCRTTVYNFINKHPDMKQLVEDERESIIDMAEGSLFKSVKMAYFPAIKFTLNTIGKDRGYIERQEQHVTGSITDSGTYERFAEMAKKSKPKNKPAKKKKK